MIELRPNGSIPSKHKLARICVMFDDEINQNWYSNITGEQEEDIAKIEQYVGFVHWASEYMPVDQADHALKILKNKDSP